MKTILISFFLLLALTGCSWFSSTGGTSKKSGTKSVKAASTQTEAQTMHHKITVEQPKESEASSRILAGPELMEATVTPGAKVTIDSDMRKDSKATEDGSTSESVAVESEKKAGLPWGVYVAIIALIAGGVFVAFNFGLSWGLPLIIGGALVYAIFTSFAANPLVVSVALGAACVVAVGVYVYHANSATATAADAASKADALSAIKRAVDTTEANVKEELKSAMKRVLGDSNNPVRQAVDNEISKA